MHRTSLQVRERTPTFVCTLNRTRSPLQQGRGTPRPVEDLNKVHFGLQRYGLWSPPIFYLTQNIKEFG
ncbi:MAG TPA: hypothetical protein DIU35_00340 [Candidatus Latescibacteria bacterium]|nr:hypothetical protein [Gemmatimonadota bacterium]HCR15905.1 hypothetical protein [Candidatus Latescibacterota bacterium]